MAYLERVFENTSEIVTIPNPIVFTGGVTVATTSILGSTAYTGDVTFGINGTGVDATFYGDTPGAYAKWDQSEDDFIIGGAARLLAGSDAAGCDVILYGAVASYAVTWDANGDTNGALYVGADTKGLMFNLYGDTTGCGIFWNPSTDTNGTLTLGASGGSKGNDLRAYGATNGCSLLWDQSADELIITKTSAVATATNIQSMTVSQTLTGASAVNAAEALRSVLTSNVQIGNWANAILGKIDFSSAGFVTGLAGVICAELDMPPVTLGNGSYCCYEAELNAPSSANGWGSSVPVAYFTGNAWGSGVAEFRDEGYIFNFTGLGTPGASKIIQANTDQPTHALRILVDGTDYFLLMTTVDNGVEI